jgi:hypothetical protein
VSGVYTSDPRVVDHARKMDHISFDELAPRNFSFNSPYGACEACDGIGTRFQVDPELIVPDEDLSIDEGAIAPWFGFRGEYFKRVLQAVGDEYGFDASTPWKKLKAAQKKIVLYGSGSTQVTVRYKNRYGRQRSYATKFEGAVPWVERRHTESDSDRVRDVIEGYMRLVPCPACGGARLRPASLAVTIGTLTLYRGLATVVLGPFGERAPPREAGGEGGVDRPHTDQNHSQPQQGLRRHGGEIDGDLRRRPSHDAQDHVRQPQGNQHRRRQGYGTLQQLSGCQGHQLRRGA